MSPAITPAASPRLPAVMVAASSAAPPPAAPLRPLPPVVAVQAFHATHLATPHVGGPARRAPLPEVGPSASFAAQPWLWALGAGAAGACIGSLGQWWLHGALASAAAALAWLGLAWGGLAAVGLFAACLVHLSPMGARPWGLGAALPWAPAPSPHALRLGAGLKSDNVELREVAGNNEAIFDALTRLLGQKSNEQARALVLQWHAELDGVYAKSPSEPVRRALRVLLLTRGLPFFSTARDDRHATGGLFFDEETRAVEHRAFLRAIGLGYAFVVHMRQQVKSGLAQARDAENLHAGLVNAVANCWVAVRLPDGHTGEALECPNGPRSFIGAAVRGYHPSFPLEVLPPAHVARVCMDEFERALGAREPTTDDIVLLCQHVLAAGRRQYGGQHPKLMDRLYNEWVLALLNERAEPAMADAERKQRVLLEVQKPPSRPLASLL